MIKINFKYVLIAFLILAISSCAIVLLTLNSSEESSSVKLITSVSVDLEASDSTDTSQSNQTEYNKQSKKTAANNRTIKRSTATASPKKTTYDSIIVEFPLDINKATKNELMQIDGVGEVTASKILSYRKKLKYYSNLLQLKEIDGIGDATYDKLRKYLYVSSDRFKELDESSKDNKGKSATKSKTTKAKTTKIKVTKSSGKTTEEKQMKMVNINTAGKEELMDCLLLDEEQALKIIDLRKRVGGRFTSALELVYEIGKSEYNRIKDYVML